MSTESSPRSNVLVLSLLGYGLLALFAILVGGVFAQFVFGWILFPVSVLPRVTADWPSVIAGVVAFVMYAFGVHRTGRWLATWLPENLIASREWRLRQTGVMVLATVLLFSLGTALVGAVHQILWLSNNRAAPSLDVSTEPSPLGLIENAQQNARRSGMRINLKQHGLGVLNFHDGNTHFPPGGTMSADGDLLHGWIAMMGPYAGISSNGIDFRVPWNQPPNDRLYRCQFDLFLNPQQPGPVFDRNGFGITHFAANVHAFPIRKADFKGAVPNYQPGASGLAVHDFSDGTSNTLLIGTVGRNHKPWGYPANVRDPGEGLNRTPTGFGGPPGKRSAHFVLADGSVCEISDKADPRILKALATPNGDEPPLVHEKGSLWIGDAP